MLSSLLPNPSSFITIIIPSFTSTPSSKLSPSRNWTMADPITAFGAAAGAVQLADAALRATREAYTFCSALKHAGEQAQELRDGMFPGFFSAPP
jgi:hypothetical protein